MVAQDSAVLAPPENKQTFKLCRFFKMSEPNLTSMPKASWEDHTHTIVRAGLSAIPILGGPAVELFSSAITPPIMKRRDKWIESIAEGLKVLEEKVENFKIEMLSQKEPFITIFLQATQTAIRNHQKEKLDALKNAILNAAINVSPDEDIQIMFIYFVDELTPWHLRVLKCLDDYYNKREGIADKLDSMTTAEKWSMFPPTETIEGFLKKSSIEVERKDFLWQVLRDLSFRGLTNTGKDILSHPNAFEITALGKEFLKFIASPIQLSEIEQ